MGQYKKRRLRPTALNCDKIFCNKKKHSQLCRPYLTIPVFVTGVVLYHFKTCTVFHCLFTHMIQFLFIFASGWAGNKKKLAVSALSCAYLFVTDVFLYHFKTCTVFHCLFTLLVLFLRLGRKFFLCLSMILSGASAFLIYLGRRAYFCQVALVIRIRPFYPELP